MFFRSKTRIAAAAIAFTIAAIGAQAQSAAWQIDPVHSDVTFTITHLGVSKVQGTFNKVSGTINIDDADITKSSVDASIEVKSLSTGNTTRDGHVLGDNFWQADKFPTMTFKSTKVETAGSGLKVFGNLTMHGVTKPVTLDVTDFSKPMPHPMKKGSMVRGFSARTTVNRKDFGMSWTGAMAGADMAVGNEINITLNIEAGK